MKLVIKSAGVFMAEGPICSIGEEELETLKAALPTSPKHHVRINAEPDAADGVIETIFAFDRQTTLRRHLPRLGRRSKKAISVRGASSTSDGGRGQRTLTCPPLVPRS